MPILIIYYYYYYKLIYLKIMIISLVLYCIYLYSIYKITEFILYFLNIFYKYYIRKPLDLNKRYGNKSYVLITGATDGIGKSISEMFSKEHFNLILVGRNNSKLLKAKNDITNNLNIKNFNSIDIITVNFDFSKMYSIDDYNNKFKDIINDYNVSILVNNVGIIAHDMYLNNTKGENLEELINVNIKSQVFLTKLFLNKIKEDNNKSNNHKLIINLSSFASDLNSNRNTIYGSTKSFNNHFSKIINYELKFDKKLKQKVDVMSVKPSYVSTNMCKLSPNFYSIITEKQFVNHLRKLIGYESETYGHIYHQIRSDLLIKYLPKIIVNYWNINYRFC